MNNIKVIGVYPNGHEIVLPIVDKDADYTDAGVTIEVITKVAIPVIATMTDLAKNNQLIGESKQAAADNRIPIAWRVNNSCGIWLYFNTIGGAESFAKTLNDNHQYDTNFTREVIPLYL